MARQFHGPVSFVGKIGVHCEGEDKMQSALGARCRSSQWSRNGRSGDRDGISFAWAFGTPLPIQVTAATVHTKDHLVADAFQPQEVIFATASYHVFWREESW